MVFCFSATGNSLYIAKNLDSCVLSIPRELLSSSKYYADETIGIVCPTYGHDIPEIVKTFIRSKRFDTRYFYMIFTYGNFHSGVAERAAEFLETVGIRAAYINTIAMVDNALPGYDMDKEREKEDSGSIEKRMREIQSDIYDGKHYIQPASAEDIEHHKEYMKRKVKLEVMDETPLFAVEDEKCILCGVCVKMCPVGSISLEQEKINFTYQSCFACLACIHACPVKAIRLNKMPEKNPDAARYRNKHIRLQELIEANQIK